MTDEHSKMTKSVRPAYLSAAKSAISILFPPVGIGFAALDAHQQERREKDTKKCIEYLANKVDDLEKFANDEWLRTEEGQTFYRKVVASALDDQIRDKQELFMNAMINGIENKDMLFEEKLDFVDMIRNLSRLSIHVLYEIHSRYGSHVQRPNSPPGPKKPFAVINPESLAQEFGHVFEDPYRVVSSVYKLQTQGLFSSTGIFKKGADGRFVTDGGFRDELTYTDYTARFVEFITKEDRSKLSTPD